MHSCFAALPLLLLLLLLTLSGRLSAAQSVRFAAMAAGRDPRLGPRLAPVPTRLRPPPLAPAWYEVAPVPEPDDTVKDKEVEAEAAQARVASSHEMYEARRELDQLDARERGLSMIDPDDYEPDAFIAMRGGVRINASEGREQMRFQQRQKSESGKPTKNDDEEGPDVDPAQKKAEEDAFMASLDYGQDSNGISTLTAPADVSSSYVDTGYSDELMERVDATRGRRSFLKRRSLLAVGGSRPQLSPADDPQATEPLDVHEEYLRMAGVESSTAETLASEMKSLVKRADAAVDQSARLLAHRHGHRDSDPTRTLRPFQASELDQPVARAAGDPRPIAMILGEAQQDQAEKKAAAAHETPLSAAYRAHEEKLMAETAAESDSIRKTLDALDEKMRWDDAAEEAEAANLQSQLAARGYTSGLLESDWAA